MNKIKRLALEAIMFMICNCKEELESEPSCNIDERESIVKQVVALAKSFETIKKS